VRFEGRWDEASSGVLQVGGHAMVTASEEALSQLRGRFVSLIFQEPMTALDPVFTIGEQIVETILRHESISRADAKERALELLELVQVPPPGPGSRPILANGPEAFASAP